MKKLILVRHGQTTSNKSNPDRGLSPRGVKQVINLASKLRSSIIIPAAIIYSTTKRASQTAHILGRYLSITDISPAPIRIKNVDNIALIIKHQQKQGITPAQAYLSLGNYKKYGVESPAQLAKRWLNIIKPIKAQTIILVSHEASLDAFLRFQYRFRLNQTSFDQFFDYADYAILIM